MGSEGGGMDCRGEDTTVLLCYRTIELEAVRLTNGNMNQWDEGIVYVHCINNNK